MKHYKMVNRSGALSLSLNEVSSNWPLIRYIINVDEYEDTYKNYVSEFVENVFNSSEMQSIYNDYYQLLKDYAYAEERSYSFLSSDSDFDSAVQTLD